MDDSDQSGSPAEAGPGRRDSTREGLDEAAAAFKAALAPRRAGPPGTADGGADDAGADDGHDRLPPPATQGEPPETEDMQDGEDEAAEEAQPAAVAMPASWSREDERLWSTLSPEAQARIAEREGQRDAAINSKFREAAELRRAHEAEIEEANLNRRLYAEAADQVLSLVVPQPPPITMLDVASSDYDPDTYHYRKALHEETVALLNSHAAQRQQIAAQEQARQFEAINGATRDAFIRSVPDVADQAKAPAVFQELIDYALSAGAPADLFASPTTALEWHVLWKAREYDRLQSARARVRETPPPEPRKAQPAVRPGVATPRGAAERQRRQGAIDRLRKEGSVEAGAAALKLLMKGQIS
ncbi:hypothetical protein [Sphingosinicella terrae]|uniref:hypothetical protein n=1 Tax=Sphingosinicella terrae TaxID=2172047 RepID=UPI000E0D806C|nr:hypothetical protein [Sphingosinicella terrae]